MCIQYYTTSVQKIRITNRIAQPFVTPNFCSKPVKMKNGKGSKPVKMKNDVECPKKKKIRRKNRVSEKKEEQNKRKFPESQVLEIRHI